MHEERPSYNSFYTICVVFNDQWRQNVLQHQFQVFAWRSILITEYIHKEYRLHPNNAKFGIWGIDSIGQRWNYVSSGMPLFLFSILGRLKVITISQLMRGLCDKVFILIHHLNFCALMNNMTYCLKFVRKTLEISN